VTIDDGWNDDDAGSAEKTRDLDMPNSTGEVDGLSKSQSLHGIAERLLLRSATDQDQPQLGMQLQDSGHCSQEVGKTLLLDEAADEEQIAVPKR
jgi:hypothetical protein